MACGSASDLLVGVDDRAQSALEVGTFFVDSGGKFAEEKSIFSLCLCCIQGAW